MDTFVVDVRRAATLVSYERTTGDFLMDMAGKIYSEEYVPSNDPMSSNGRARWSVYAAPHTPWAR
jgi:hypothetical protein